MYKFWGFQKSGLEQCTIQRMWSKGLFLIVKKISSLRFWTGHFSVMILFFWKLYSLFREHLTQEAPWRIVPQFSASLSWLQGRSGLGNRSFALHSFPLFSKEQLCDCLLILSLKKSNRSFCRSLQKSKRANALLSLFWEERMGNLSFCSSFQKSHKKSNRSLSIWTNTGQSLIAHFQKSDCVIAWSIAL